jgi:uncharacterized protein YbjT (DUF2867 family)
MNVLVTGAAGMVGRAVVPVLRSAGHRVVASGIDSGRAQRLLGWQATRSWRDYLTHSGEPR